MTLELYTVSLFNNLTRESFIGYPQLLTELTTKYSLSPYPRNIPPPHPFPISEYTSLKSCSLFFHKLRIIVSLVRARLNFCIFSHTFILYTRVWNRENRYLTDFALTKCGEYTQSWPKFVPLLFHTHIHTHKWGESAWREFRVESMSTSARNDFVFRVARESSDVNFAQVTINYRLKFN